MKKTILLFPLLLSAVSASASEYIDSARVIAAYPVTERRETPHTECEELPTQAPIASSVNRSYGGAVLGAVAGGLLGGTVGKGNGKAVAAGVGAAVGALVGDRIQNKDEEGGPLTRERACRTVYTVTTRPLGYDVLYEYQGRQFTERMARAPSGTVPVVVNVQLAPQPSAK